MEILRHQNRLRRVSAKRCNIGAGDLAIACQILPKPAPSGQGYAVFRGTARVVWVVDEPAFARNDLARHFRNLLHHCPFAFGEQTVRSAG
jgi:hypothetical protein